MAVLVTGGAGFLGSYVVAELLRDGEDVIVYDVATGTNVLDRVVPSDARSGLTLMEGDLCDARGLLELCQRESVDRVVHLAAPLTDWVQRNPPAGLIAMCGGTAELLEVARTLGIQRVVWTSSISVYGRSYDVRTGSASPRRPESLYGSFKVLCEDLALAYAADHGVESVGLRLPVVFGPWRARGLEASLGQDGDPFRDVALGRPVVVRRPNRTLNWLYVEDASALLVRSLRATGPLESLFDVTGEIASMREIAGFLQGLAPTAAVSVEEAAACEPDQEVLMVPLDDRAVRAQIGWRPRHTLREGIAATLTAYAAAGEDAPPP